MRLANIKSIVFVTILILISCGSSTKEKKSDIENPSTTVAENVNPVSLDNDSVPKIGRRIDGLSTTHIFTGANQWTKYMPLLEGKKVGVLANQTSIVNDTLEYPRTGEVRVIDVHLVDFLVEFNIDVRKVYAPEHGFRGTADAGETVKDGVDTKTGLPVISLYGKNKKLTQEQLEGIDVVVFDIQDVGVRFYTYIATMHYVMEACAEKGIPLVILDRPNPNAHYIDGPTMEAQHTNFLGLHTVPLVHGMTIGEYAQMINGEGWLRDNLHCDITVVKMENYTRNTSYSLPIRPSPNLPNDIAINLYPSLGLLEGTTLNAGRGTEMQFQIMGSPLLPKNTYSFEYIPQPNFGAKYPKHKGTKCNGIDLRTTSRMNQLDLKWIIEAYQNFEDKSKFFNTENFTAHAGTTLLQQQIEQGLTFSEIKTTWQKGLTRFDQMRQPYLIYE